MADARQVENVAEIDHDLNAPGGDDKSPAFKKMAKALEENMKPFKEAAKTQQTLPDPGKQAQPKQDPPKQDQEPKKPSLKTLSSKPEEPPKEPEKQVEPEIEVPASFKTGKASEDWKKAHAAFREKETKLQSQLDGLAKELEAAKTAPKVDPKELQSIREERDKLLEKLETVALERSDRFQKQYNDQMTKAASRAKSAVGEAHALKIESLISLPPSQWRDEQINAIREDLTGVQQGRLDIAVADMDKIRDDMQSALQDSRNRLAQLQEEEKQKAEMSKVQSVQMIEQNIQKALELANKSSAFTEIEGDEEHNGSLAGRLDKVKKFFKGELDPEEVIKMPLLAEENLWLNSYYIPQLQKENEELKAQLSAINGSRPGMGQRGGTAKSASGKMSFTEKFLTEYSGS